MFGNARRIAITGAGGNLGRKLIAAFEHAPWCRSIVVIDQAVHEGGITDGSTVIAVQADLADRQDRRRVEAIGDAEAIVHLAAQNPYPTASWEDAIASFDMTLNLLGAAETTGVTRFVFISSTHVMGGYKDAVPAIPSGGLGGSASAQAWHPDT